MVQVEGGQVNAADDTRTRFADLRIPDSGNALGATIGYSLVIVLTVLGACNLLLFQSSHFVSILASCLWLLTTSWIIFENIRDAGGIRLYLVHLLRVYSKQHVVRAIPEHDAKSIAIGYLMFGRFLTYLTIDVSALTSVEWNSGQATAMARRDLDDWHVALWYRSSSSQLKKSCPGMRQEEISILGPSGSRASVEVFGIQLVEFLGAVGVELTPGRNDQEFITSTRRMAVESEEANKLK